MYDHASAFEEARRTDTGAAHRPMIGYQLSILAAQRPEATALVFGARRYDYATLNERACRLANGLKALPLP